MADDHPHCQHLLGVEVRRRRRPDLSGRLSAGVTFVLIFLTGIIGMAIVQSTFNGLQDQQGQLPRAQAL